MSKDEDSPQKPLLPMLPPLTEEEAKVNQQQNRRWIWPVFPVFDIILLALVVAFLLGLLQFLVSHTPLHESF